jgi:hypothetical protein
MAIATDSHTPDRFRRPATVGSATICRLSGQLATEECRQAHVVDEEGNLTRESTAYTEHFVRGTEPTDYCDAHLHHPPPPTLPGTVAVSTPGAPTPGAAPTAEVATTGTDDADPAASTPGDEAEPERRRSIWSRIFGFGRDRDNDGEATRDVNQGVERILPGPRP